MPTVSYAITATANDASSASGVLDATGVIQGNPGAPYYAGLRFLGIVVPQGATITSATFTLVVGGAFGAGNGASLGKWRGVASDNAPAWTAANLGTTSNRTTASTTVLGSTTVETTRSHDVAAIVQEIVNRAGWASGNALAIAGDPTGATNYCPYYDYADNPGKAAMLSITYADAGGGGLSGAASITLGALSASSTGKVALAGTAARALGTLTSATTGKVALKGVAAPTLGVVTSSAAGKLAIAGSAASNLSAVTLSATGIQTGNTGALSSTLAAATAAGSGSLAIQGEASAALAAVTLSAAGSAPALTGTIASQLADLTVAASSTLALRASAAPKLAPLTLVMSAEDPSEGSGSLLIQGEASIALEAMSVSATGGVAQIAGTGQVAFALTGLTCAGDGRLPIQGTGAASLAPLSASAVAAIAIGGTAAVVLAPVALSAVARNIVALPVPPSRRAATTGESRIAHPAPQPSRIAETAVTPRRIAS